MLSESLLTQKKVTNIYRYRVELMAAHVSVNNYRYIEIE